MCTAPHTPATVDVGRQPRTTASNAAIERRYLYDASGQLTRQTDSLRGERSFGYDATGRILSAQGGQHTEQFSFDPASNLIPAGAPPQRDNRVTVYQDLRFEYDAHGNVITRKKGAHEVAHYTWNADHQLTQATVTRHGVTQVTRYDYDALGRRVAKHDAFGATQYLWDGDLMIQSQRGSKEALYLFEPDSFVPLATVQDGQTYWYQCDQIGTPQELTDATGEVVWAVDYKVWGEAKLRATGTDGMPIKGFEDSGSSSRTSPIEQPFRFQGQQFDEETGLHYNRFRYYDPTAGRFVSQDPIGLLGGHNSFKYASNPITWIDTLGLSPKNLSSCGCQACPLCALQSRAEELHGNLPKRTQGATTTAVGKVTKPDGSSEIWVASSEKNLRRPIKNSLGSNEVAISGVGHAEETILNAAKEKGYKVEAIAASRPVCSDCEAMMKESGTQRATVTSGKRSRGRL